LVKINLIAKIILTFIFTYDIFIIIIVNNIYIIKSNLKRGNAMNNTNNSVKLSTYRNSYIVTGIFFALAILLCSVANNFISDMFPVTLVLSYIIAFICAITICIRCAKANKIINPAGFNPPRDTFFYLRRMGFIFAMMVLMSLGVSLAGMFINGIASGFLQRDVESLFLRGFIVKLPLFIVYLVLIYKMFIRYGFMDSERKIFNLNLKMLTVIIALIIMTPNAIYDSMFYTAPTDTLLINIQTMLSPNIDKFIIEFDGFSYVNENFTTFNAIMVVVTVLLTFAIQAGVAWFAYNRGKQIFIKQHIREIDYDMDENI